jgi:hypothetical protein
MKEASVGIRKSRGKNKKNKRVVGAIAVKREETLRRADKGTQRGRRSPHA